MEFGIFVQGHVPKAKQEAEGFAAEHNAIMGDAQLCVEADKHNWKYAWVTEHHFLTEYSHTSASDVFMGYIAALTERIHIGSGIFSFNPHKDHPVRIAERVAMLDHMTEGRFEFGTGRGAGTIEVTGFDIESTDATREIYTEFLVEIPKMWKTDKYSHKGKAFNVPYPGQTYPTRDVLPKPWVAPHPPIWVAAGSESTFEKAGKLGIGVLAFTNKSIPEVKPLVDMYKNAVRDAKPVGDFVNDNVMITTGMVCLKDGKKAREAVTKMGLTTLQSMVFYYHDTIPSPEGAIKWPAPALQLDLDMVEYMITNGYMIAGNPDECAEQIARLDTTGIDQLVFGMPINLPHDQALESIELFGDHVIPEFDKDHEFRSNRFRSEAAALAGHK